MDRHYAMRLLREVVKNPQAMLKRRKFWNVDFFDYYLKRCDMLLFSTPAEGLVFTKYAPALAEKVATNDPEASRPVLLLRAHGHLGGAYRRSTDFVRSEASFVEGLRYEKFVPGHILADFYMRLAYLRIFQHRPESFQLIAEGIAIHKRGNLVDRHALGECLLCRGHAYIKFDQPGKALEDFTAALNHLSLKRDPKPYYATLHNLAVWAVDFGELGEIAGAIENLKPALSILNSYPRRQFAKYKLRWLIALLEARLGHFGQAEITFLEVREGLIRLKMPDEVGLLAIDMARLYLKQGRIAQVRTLAEETIGIFRRLKVEPKVQEVLDLLRQADNLTEEKLTDLRDYFAARAQPPAPQLAA